MATIKPRQPGELIFSYLLLAGSLWLGWTAYQIAGFSRLSSPGALPMAAAAVMVLSAAINVVNTHRRMSAPLGSFFEIVVPPIVIGFAVLVLVYAATLDWLGFALATTGFLALAFIFLQRGSPLKLLGVAVLTVIVIYAIFRLVFQVLLPEGILPEREFLAWLEDQIRTLLP